MLPFVLSPSALKKFQTCPRQFEATYITKEIPYSQSPQAARGDSLHKLMEQAILKGWLSIDWPEPDNMQHAKAFVEAVDRLRANDWTVCVEESIAISRDKQARGWHDRPPLGFMRCRVDVYAVHPHKDYVIIIDWKTGKKWATDKIQLAVNALCLYPVTGRTDYRAMFAYIDSGEVVEHSCAVPPVAFDAIGDSEGVHPDVRAVYDLVWDLEGMMRTGVWSARPNNLCRFCGLHSCKFRG